MTVLMQVSAETQSSCPGLSRASTYFLSGGAKNLDGRDEPGHDVW